MEDAAEAVVPLRPGFDIQVRGFNRNQVIDHIDLLEDQIRIVSIDRNEAIRLSADLRRLYEDTRQDLIETQQRLRNVESSDTGLPAASQRVRNMLDSAEEEVQTLRDKANRQAEIIRGAAENEARELIAQAERTTEELRSECSELAAEIEARRKKLENFRTHSLSELRNREYKMRQAIRDEYKHTIAVAQQEADELLAQTHEQCAQRNAETERWRQQSLDEIHTQRARLEELRKAVLKALDNAGDMIGTSTSTLRAQLPGPLTSDSVEPQQEQLRVPEQRDDTHTFIIPLDQHLNGASPEPDASDAVR